MTKQKILYLLSVIGFLYFISLAVNVYQQKQMRGDVIVDQVHVPPKFAREFSRVINKNRAEDLPSTPFMAPDGSDFNWPDFAGQYTLVNFWATWCPPCIVELPSLDRLQKKYQDAGLNVVAISLDKRRSADDIKTFLKTRKISNFAAYLDIHGNIQKKIRMRGIPTTYLLNPQGQITHIFEGDANWSSRGAYRFFDRILKQNKA